ncbi:MAG: hypothetical protein MJ153_03345, partial [Clostridia bacterium]|nr:hypothetical protein [Clostridia bacterium]
REFVASKPRIPVELQYFLNSVLDSREFDNLYYKIPVKLQVLSESVTESREFVASKPRIPVELQYFFEFRARFSGISVLQP